MVMFVPSWSQIIMKFRFRSISISFFKIRLIIYYTNKVYNRTVVLVLNVIKLEYVFQAGDFLATRLSFKCPRVSELKAG